MCVGFGHGCKMLGTRNLEIQQIDPSIYIYNDNGKLMQGGDH